MGSYKSAFALALTASLILAACGGDDDGESETKRPLAYLHGCPPPPAGSVDDVGLFTGETQDMPGFDDFLMTEGGYEETDIFTFLYPEIVCPPNRDYAEELGPWIDDVLAETGADRLDIIAFSMGAVASRIYIKDGGAENVEHWVSIAGASHGSVLAGMVGEAGQEQFGFPYYQGALEVAPEYACEGESTDEDIQFYLNGCLTEDGRTVEVDETPFGEGDEGGHIKYLSIWNTEDDLVTPQEASCLNQQFINDCSDPVNVMITAPAMTEFLGTQSAHVETQFDPGVRQTVLDFLSE